VEPASEHGAQHIEGKPSIFFCQPLDIRQRVAQLWIEDLERILYAKQLVRIGVERSAERYDGAGPWISRSAREQTIDGSVVSSWDTTNDLAG